MMADLDNNAMGASDKYKDKYLEITGKLTNIDASGKYIDLMADGDFEIIGVQCYIKMMNKNKSSFHDQRRDSYFKREMYRCWRSLWIFS